MWNEHLFTAYNTGVFIWGRSHIDIVWKVLVRLSRPISWEFVEFSKNMGRKKKKHFQSID